MWTGVKKNWCCATKNCKLMLTGTPLPLPLAGLSCQCLRFWYSLHVNVVSLTHPCRCRISPVEEKERRVFKKNRWTMVHIKCRVKLGKMEFFFFWPQYILVFLGGVTMWNVNVKKHKCALEWIQKRKCNQMVALLFQSTSLNFYLTGPLREIIFWRPPLCRNKCPAMEPLTCPQLVVLCCRSGQ